MKENIKKHIEFTRTLDEAFDAIVVARKKVDVLLPLLNEGYQDQDVVADMDLDTQQLRTALERLSVFTKKALQS